MGVWVVGFYCYLNLESTKTILDVCRARNLFYCYLNLENTKTDGNVNDLARKFYCYLNLESTKTCLSIRLPL